MKTLTQNDMLAGPILKKLFAFALPLILTNLLQVFYSAADMMVVGLSGVSGAIGAIGTTNAMTSLIVNSFIGLSVGANVAVSRSIGAGEQEDAGNAAHTSLLLSLFLGLAGMAIGLLLCRSILVSMGDQGTVLELAVLYSKIYFIGAPFCCITNYAAAIFRAKGDTQTPLLVLSCAGILNVLLNLLFVLGFHMSVDGVAIATAVSNGVSAAVLLWLLSRADDCCRFSFKKLGFHKKALGEILRIGLPAGIQSALFSLSNMLIQSSIIGINNTVCPGGSAVLDGNAAAGSLENFVYMATNSAHHTALTFVSQHCGAGLHRRNTRVIRSCYLLAAIISFVTGGIILLLHDPLVSLYVREPDAAAAAMTRLWYLLTTYFLCGFMEVGSAVLRSYGRSITSTMVSLLGACVFRIFWIMTVVRATPTLDAVYISYPLSWLLTALASYLIVLPLRRKLIREEALAL